jgi:hypothetical protein
MHSDHGEPGAKVPPAIIASSGILPIAGLASGGTGTLMANWRRNFPSPSNTWMRWLPRSAT